MDEATDQGIFGQARLHGSRPGIALSQLGHAQEREVLARGAGTGRGERWGADQAPSQDQYCASGVTKHNQYLHR